jgi:hypothetical protein
MTRTAAQIISDALKLLGVLSAVDGSEVPTTPEQADSFTRLNELIDSWGTHAGTLLVRARVSVPVVTGTQTYTLGPTGTVVVPRPMTIDAAAVLVSGVEIPVAVLDEQQYAANPIKTLSGTLVTQVLYSPLMGDTGELWVWPVPAQGQTLVVYYDEPVAQFPDLTTPVTLAPGYARALRTNLAVELAPEFGRQVDPLIDRAAHESLADVKRANARLSDLGLAPQPGVGGAGYNIYSDT